MRRWQGLVLAAVVVVLIVLALGAAPDLVRRVATSRLALGPLSDDSGHARLLGCVENGQFRILAPSAFPGSTARPTEMQMQEARAPESAELDLAPHDGRCIVLQGRDGGGWIYSAHVVQPVDGALVFWLLQRAF